MEQDSVVYKISMPKCVNLIAYFNRRLGTWLPLLVTTLGKFQFFVTILLILQHLLMRYIWNHCHQAADMVQIEPPSWHYHMDLGFAIHKADLLKHEAIQ